LKFFGDYQAFIPVSRAFQRGIFYLIWRKCFVLAVSGGSSPLQFLRFRRIFFSESPGTPLSLKFELSKIEILDFLAIGYDILEFGIRNFYFSRIYFFWEFIFRGPSILIKLF